MLDDLKAIKGYIAGVIAFGTAVSAYLIKVLDLDEQITLFTVVGIAALMLVIGFLVQRAERRQQAALDAHITSSTAIVDEMRTNMLETQRSSLRTEMNLMMYIRPDNHDTILKMAHRYFIELKGDWVETDEFGAWLEREEAAGRKVHVPSGLAAVVAELQAKEMV